MFVKYHVTNNKTSKTFIEKHDKHREAYLEKVKTEEKVLLIY